MSSRSSNDARVVDGDDLARLTKILERYTVVTDNNDGSLDVRVYNKDGSFNIVTIKLSNNVNDGLEYFTDNSFLNISGVMHNKRVVLKIPLNAKDCLISWYKLHEMNSVLNNTVMVSSANLKVDYNRGL